MPELDRNGPPVKVLKEKGRFELSVIVSMEHCTNDRWLGNDKKACDKASNLALEEVDCGIMVNAKKIMFAR